MAELFTREADGREHAFQLGMGRKSNLNFENI